jgi:2-polyprenyl-3-methyl-5-hydroxy-6-metoxy-1,4-benzoquinol methylase
VYGEHELVTFTAHNIRLDDGTYTKPDADHRMEEHPWFLAAKRVIDATFPGDKSHLRLVDLGCLEGGYTVEFARLGLQSLGLDVREANIEAARYVQSKVNLPNLRFVQDDVWNTEKYGLFDFTFCCGLLYHVDKPVELLRLLSRVTTRVLFLQTHFSEARDSPSFIHPRKLRRAIGKIVPLAKTATTTHKLSFLKSNEGIRGRWFPEFRSDSAWRDRANRRWASWNNRHSFWPQREYLPQVIRDVGFDLVFEQFDALGQDIAGEMLHGTYRTSGRSTFVGIKTSYAASERAPAAPAALRRE